MSSNVYSLTLVAGPMRETTSHIFHDVVHRDDAWQRAARTQFGLESDDGDLAALCRAGQHPSMQSLNRITQIYKYAGFTEALAALASRTSSRGGRFGGNFDAGTPWSAAEVDALVEKHSKLDVDEWVETYFDRADHPMFVDPEKWVPNGPAVPQVL
ncbi:uncharacterized protein PODANS_4_595 [Podospora anserina S mat+]|uniref:Podospora anserina S mat+ genomic DNA chromosome 4, supercontig 1 n=1 Tax=Podospora anserina (strain S / ATCC MYA-4624 / DSM 980 / FGSC 10383) TaxID=515849 RepID=B2ADB1_PODAN|nr:uncharacterized protein PODANS_4_595 [Podospora anserina S mat+]CAP61426.1 unnamed protein product [Podospora anserina S mat+]CDP27780.1 Putative protein of unknown function [Podospora anserina S mat+]